MQVFAVNAKDVDQVAQELAKTLGISLTRRDSSFLGEYCHGKLIDCEFKVYLNHDPLYREGIDAPDEEYFEPAFKAHRVLVGVSGTAEVAEIVRKALQKQFG